jgi:hypothetical protein
MLRVLACKRVQNARKHPQTSKQANKQMLAHPVFSAAAGPGLLTLLPLAAGVSACEDLGASAQAQTVSNEMRP